MDSLLRMLLLLAGSYYFLSPLLIRFTQKMKAAPNFQPLNPSELQPDVWRYVCEVSEALRPLGFVPTAYIQMPDQVPNVRAYLVMLLNRESGDKAMVTVINATQVPSMSTRYLEFSTRFEDGRMFDTFNGKTLNSFKIAPEETKTQVPSVQDPAELYRLHRYVMERANARGRTVTYEDGQALQYVTERVLRESYEQQVKFGWLYLDKRHGVYRPTWLGAFMMTWGLLWPMAAIRTHRMRENERRLLAEFRGASGSAGRTQAASG